MDEGQVAGLVGDSGTTTTEAATPLKMIRERETELSRRVLVAKREADEIVAEARRQAAAVIEEATNESAVSARDRFRVLREQTDSEAHEMVARSQQEAAALSKAIEPKLGAAVDFVMTSVVAD